MNQFYTHTLWSIENKMLEVQSKLLTTVTSRVEKRFLNFLLCTSALPCLNFLRLAPIRSDLTHTRPINKEEAGEGQMSTLSWEQPKEVRLAWQGPYCRVMPQQQSKREKWGAVRTEPRDPTSLHLYPLEPSRGPTWHSGTVLLREDDTGMLALQEMGHLTFNRSASPGRFKACCFFIPGYPLREPLLIVNPAAVVKLPICYAFYMLTMLCVSSHFIPVRVL